MAPSRLDLDAIVATVHDFVLDGEGGAGPSRRLVPLEEGESVEAPEGLTRREVEVLRLLATGMSNREIADTLVISARTVERHIANIYAKINANGRAQATAFALGHAL